LKAQRKQEYLTRHESRQAAMKRRQTEREEREAKRIKLHHLQREEARVRNQEQKMRNETRKRLDEEERALHKKEEQVERDLRKYSTHRIKPLGRDKFYNRYYYLDDIGGTLLDALLEWLNPKGVREFRLKRELEKYYQNIVTGMKKRLAEQSSSSKNEVIRRTTRSKTIPTYPPGSWLAYTNKLAYS
ncbi:hypothetical protein CU097_001680, partial [Rhizopus azygosporus]